MIVRILELILFTLCTASLTMFLMKCMEKGMIFRKYYNWITYWFWLDRKIQGQVLIKYIPRGAAFLEDLNGMCIISPKFLNNKFQWLWKILGGCKYCFGTWTFIVLYLFSISPISNISLTVYGLILGCGLNYLWIEVINKIKK